MVPAGSLASPLVYPEQIPFEPRSVSKVKARPLRRTTAQEHGAYTWRKAGRSLGKVNLVNLRPDCGRRFYDTRPVGYL